MTDKPKEGSWLADIKKSKELRIWFDKSLSDASWQKVFESAVTEFNRLSQEWSLGVRYEPAQDAASAQVEARATKGVIKIPDADGREQTIQFDPKGVHGHIWAYWIDERDPQTRAVGLRIRKALIYVPATPMGQRNGKPSLVGDPVKLVIAVHELLHGCGVLDNSLHSVDDVFNGTPGLQLGDRPDQDRATTLKGREPDPRLGGRVVSVRAEMPPIFLKDATAKRIRNLWT